MTITFDEPKPDHDHQLARCNGKVFGYRSLDGQRIGVTRCAECGLENYALAVASGVCAWCGWKP